MAWLLIVGAALVAAALGWVLARRRGIAPTVVAVALLVGLVIALGNASGDGQRIVAGATLGLVAALIVGQVREFATSRR